MSQPLQTTLVRVSGSRIGPMDVAALGRAAEGVAILWEVDDARAVAEAAAAAGIPTHMWSPQDELVAGRIYLSEVETVAADPTAGATGGALHLRDRFLATLSHELRNPLMAITTASELIRDRVEGAKARRAASVIVRQVRHMAHLLDDLLDVSRVRLDEIDMQRERIDLRRTLDDSVSEVHALARHADMQLTFTKAQDPVFVFADATRTRQVLVNLVDNAVKFSDPRSRIDVEVAQEGAFGVIRVRDQGHGMDATTRGRAFEPFFKADPSHEGLGLGLALVAAIVEGHGGTVEALSEGPGRGTEIVVRLPVSAAPESRVAEPSAPLSIASEPRRVLLVEDQEDNRELMQMLLASRGFEVEAEGTAREAIARFEAERFDVAIVDLGLPDAPGFEVARAIRGVSRPQRVLLIALTGHGQPGDREAAREAGFDHHVVKPTDVDTLAKLIERAFGPPS